MFQKFYLDDARAGPFVLHEAFKATGEERYRDDALRIVARPSPRIVFPDSPF